MFLDDISDFLLERKAEFVIDLVPSISLMSMSPYRMSASDLSEMKKQLEELLEKKFFRQSVSPWGMPILLVKKKYGSMRLCVNYRQLNKMKIKNKYPFRGLMTRWINYLVLACLVRSICVWVITRFAFGACMSAFRMKYDHYEYTVMSFGVSNAHGVHE